MTEAKGEGTVATRAVRGSAVQLVGQLAAQLLRLASNLIMTRLLLPDAFGLVAIVQAVLTGLQLVSDVGVWQSIVRSKRGDDPLFLDTAFSMHAIRGVIMCAVGMLTAVPAALLYQRDEFLLLLPVASVQALLMGLESTHIASAHRHLKLGKLTMLEIGAQLLALAVSVPLAMAWRSPWALIVATLVSALARTALSHVWLEGQRNRFRWDRAALDEILVFGRWSFVSTLLFFVCMRWDAFALGRLEGMELLGVYGLALLIVSVPSTIGERISGMVLTPILAESFRDDPHRFDESLRRALSAALPAVGVLFLGAAMTAPAFFRLLYLEVYADAGWMTQLVLVGAWIVFVQECGTRALLAVGDARSMAITNLVRLCFTVLCTAVGYLQFDFIGFLIGGMVGNLAGFVTNAWRLRVHGLRVTAVSARSTALVLLLGAVACGAPLWLAPLWGWPSPYVTLLSVPLVLGPYALVALRRTRRMLAAGL